MRPTGPHHLQTNFLRRLLEGSLGLWRAGALIQAVSSLYDQGQALVRITMFGDLRIGFLLFMDNVVLLAPSVRDLQLSLNWFAADCEAA